MENLRQGAWWKEDCRTCRSSFRRLETNFVGSVSRSKIHEAELSSLVSMTDCGLLVALAGTDSFFPALTTSCLAVTIAVTTFCE